MKHPLFQVDSMLTIAGCVLHGRCWTRRYTSPVVSGNNGLMRSEDFEAAKAKALQIGAVACYIEDIRREFIEELCFPAIQCNAVYENIYLLGRF